MSTPWLKFTSCPLSQPKIRPPRSPRNTPSAPQGTARPLGVLKSDFHAEPLGFGDDFSVIFGPLRSAPPARDRNMRAKSLSAHRFRRSRADMLYIPPHACRLHSIFCHISAVYPNGARAAESGKITRICRPVLTAFLYVVSKPPAGEKTRQSLFL